MLLNTVSSCCLLHATQKHLIHNPLLHFTHRHSKRSPVLHRGTEHCCHAQKLKKAEPSQAEKDEAEARAAVPTVGALQLRLQTQDAPSAQDAALTLLLLGKRVDVMELGQQEKEAAAGLLASIARLLNDRSERVAQATTFANNLHPMWQIESTAPPRIQLLTSSELRKVSWALSKIKAKLGLEEPELLQGVLTQLAFDQDD